MHKITGLSLKTDEKKETLYKNQIKLIRDYGVEGDAHGGPGDRQISLLGEDDIKVLEKDREKGICIERFIPNLTVSGSSGTMEKGEHYLLGESEITISNASKKCHDNCPLRERENRICLLPAKVRFASVHKSGTVKIGNFLNKG